MLKFHTVGNFDGMYSFTFYKFETLISQQLKAISGEATNANEVKKLTVKNGNS